MLPFDVKFPIGPPYFFSYIYKNHFFSPHRPFQDQWTPPKEPPRESSFFLKSWSYITQWLMRNPKKTWFFTDQSAHPQLRLPSFQVETCVKMTNSRQSFFSYYFYHPIPTVSIPIRHERSGKNELWSHITPHIFYQITWLMCIFK